ncbi:filamentous hemagglutinin family protein [Bradyrhizobium sp. LM3.6]
MRRPSAKRDNDELTLRRLARFRSMSLLCAMQMVFLPVFSVRLQAQPANVITPDGRTGTSLQTSGSVTNVTTSTVSGNSAFNSFSQFSVGQGNTVNLQLPTGTQNLVNIVRDAPVYVNGTLNSYMNGAIGGNVYFADPKGFVVGRSGTVNVGSLSVSTPTREFTDSLIGAGGQINGSAVGNLMAGSFPVSPDGNIRIYGRINAQDGVRLTGQNIFVGGGASQRDIANLDHAAKFSASVNSKGLRSAAAITVRNGSIHIGAVNNATVNGRLTARSKSTTPSSITVVAGNKAELGKNARLSTASKTADAGGVLVKAGNDVTVKSGAKINASSKAGNAGLVELSGNGVIDVGRGVTINLAAPNGRAGTLLIDPTDVVIGDMSQGDVGVTLGNTSVANAIAALSASGTYLVQADHSVTLAAHAVIDARNLDAAKTHSVGNAINVEIDAPTISIVNGAKILAQAINISGTTYTSGSVTLTATANDTKLSGQATATTGITIDGQITGGDISIGATSTATSSFTSSVPGLFTLVGTTLAASLLGLNGGYVAASATAVVNINGNANINGAGNVDITSHGSETAQDPALASTLLGGSPIGAAAVVGKLDGNVTTNVASGATISAGGNLNIHAINDATLNVTAVAATSSAQFVATVAYSTGSVSTSANVATGANLSVGNVIASGNSLTVRAINNNSFSTSATAVALSTPNASGGIGGALAISDVTTSATAKLGSSLGTSASSRDERLRDGRGDVEHHEQLDHGLDHRRYAGRDRRDPGFHGLHGQPGLDHRSAYDPADAGEFRSEGRRRAVAGQQHRKRHRVDRAESERRRAKPLCQRQCRCRQHSHRPRRAQQRHGFCDRLGPHERRGSRDQRRGRMGQFQPQFERLYRRRHRDQCGQHRRRRQHLDADHQYLAEVGRIDRGSQSPQRQSRRRRQHPDQLCQRHGRRGRYRRRRRLDEPFRREQRHHGVGGQQRQPDRDMHGGLRQQLVRDGEQRRRPHLRRQHPDRGDDDDGVDRRRRQCRYTRLPARQHVRRLLGGRLAQFRPVQHQYDRRRFGRCVAAGGGRHRRQRDHLGSDSSPSRRRPERPPARWR